MTNKLPAICRNIRSLRHKAGLSQDKLSKLAGLTLHTITKIEIGATDDPRISTVKRLAAAFHVSIDSLVK